MLSSCTGDENTVDEPGSKIDWGKNRGSDTSASFKFSELSSNDENQLLLYYPVFFEEVGFTRSGSVFEAVFSKTPPQNTTSTKNAPAAQVDIRTFLDFLEECVIFIVGYVGFIFNIRYSHYFAI